MSESIYLLGEDGSLRGMKEEPYANEDLLQTLVEQHPELLAGDQMNPASPRRWLLISREMAVPDEADGSSRWSLDHLFVDQDGIPTLVEVKRSSDTRLRREVVGQMMDYAANGVVFWPIDLIQSRFEEICQADSEEPEDVLSRFLGPGEEKTTETFWEIVDGNLRSGRIRLVFLADQIPTELQRVVEFLNEQMSRVDVVAVELKQFVGEGLQTLVPRLVGQTAIAKQQKSSLPNRVWNERTFIEHLSSDYATGLDGISKNIFSWAKSRNALLDWGRGKKHGSFRVMFDVGGETPFKPVYVETKGSKVNVWVDFKQYGNHHTFESAESRTELINRLNGIEGIAIPDDKIDGWGVFPLAALMKEGAIKQYFDVIEWAVEEVRNGNMFKGGQPKLNHL